MKNLSNSKLKSNFFLPIVKQHYPNSVALNNVLKKQLFVIESYGNHLCIKDEPELLKFILTYKDSAV